jgi:hypothetical protein
VAYHSDASKPWVSLSAWVSLLSHRSFMSMRPMLSLNDRIGFRKTLLSDVSLAAANCTSSRRYSFLKCIQASLDADANTDRQAASVDRDSLTQLDSKQAVATAKNSTYHCPTRSKDSCSWELTTAGSVAAMRQRRRRIASVHAFHAQTCSRYAVPSSVGPEARPSRSLEAGVPLGPLHTQNHVRHTVIP